ncbi:MAG TPA: imidazolonepropionase, partial [Minicystis sp.]|nr:imidazolonepropionase [Minicystis sp.]
MSGAFVLHAPRVVTCDAARATAGDPLGVVEGGAVLVENGRISAVGKDHEVAARARGVEVRALEGVLTPGLVDAHTHAPWAGSRHHEYAMRMAGAGYEEIAKAGGGIVSTMRAVRAASREELLVELCLRVERMTALGVTTIECKSGYGLDEANEAKQLEVVAAASARVRARLVPTYLALHALPPEAAGDRDAYAARVADAWLPAIAAKQLARFVDAYVDRAAFTVEQARRVLATG